MPLLPVLHHAYIWTLSSPYHNTKKYQTRTYGACFFVLNSRQIEKLDDWCQVIVGDKKSKSFQVKNFKNTVFLDTETQSRLRYKILDVLPYNHFGRKNIGYLFAIEHGANIIYDTDDDNILKFSKIPDEWPTFESVSTNHNTMNINELFLPNNKTWPRGYPLDRINKKYSIRRDNAKIDREPAIIQSMADHDPDVDAIFRLTRSLPITFNKLEFSPTIQRDIYVPFNAQATIFNHRAFFGLLLPITVPGRVTDIWRSYIIQRLLWDQGDNVAFTNAWVTQCRNSHDYTIDFKDENDLYHKAGDLIEHLKTIEFKGTSSDQKSLELYKSLVQKGFLKQQDYDLMSAWIVDLKSFGIQFQPDKLPIHRFVEKEIEKIHITDTSCEESAVERKRESVDL